VKLLVFTTLFPHPGAPHHGVFVLERLRHWLAGSSSSSGSSPSSIVAPREAVVVAPVPWVPRLLARGRHAALWDVPIEERREGIRVFHPRYLLLPKMGMSLAPLTLARAGLKCARRLIQAGERFDLVDAHYLYPDGVAAARIAGSLSLPLVVTARGSDVTLLPRYSIPRRWLRWMLARASAAVVVAEALRRELAPLAPRELPIVTLRNGVDLERFRPLPRDAARARLKWPPTRRIVLSVGHLIERKGHHHLLAALPRLPADVDVKIVGDGEERARLERLAASLGVAARVEFCGRMAHEELHVAFSAADALALLSSREGWPNVLLESMACGTPVVATRVHGTPEVVRDLAVGRLVDSTEPPAVAAALEELLSHPRDRGRVRAYAEDHSWTRTVDGMEELFLRVVASRRGAVA